MNNEPDDDNGWIWIWITDNEDQIIYNFKFCLQGLDFGLNKFLFLQAIVFMHISYIILLKYN